MFSTLPRYIRLQNFLLVLALVSSWQCVECMLNHFHSNYVTLHIAMTKIRIYWQGNAILKLPPLAFFDCNTCISRLTVGLQQKEQPLIRNAVALVDHLNSSGRLRLTLIWVPWKDIKNLRIHHENKFFLFAQSKALSRCRSCETFLAALVPSSIAPSMKLRHPTAQSEFAKNTLPCLARRTSKYCVRNSLPGKNQAPLAYGSSDQLWKTLNHSVRIIQMSGHVLTSRLMSIFVKSVRIFFVSLMSFSGSKCVSFAPNATICVLLFGRRPSPKAYTNFDPGSIDDQLLRSVPATSAWTFTHWLRWPVLIAFVFPEFSGGENLTVSNTFNGTVLITREALNRLPSTEVTITWRPESSTEATGQLKV